MKTKIMSLHHDDSLTKHYKIKKNLFIIAKKILLAQNIEKYKRIYLEL